MEVLIDARACEVIEALDRCQEGIRIDAELFCEIRQIVRTRNRIGHRASNRAVPKGKLLQILLIENQVAGKVWVLVRQCIELTKAGDDSLEEVRRRTAFPPD